MTGYRKEMINDLDSLIKSENDGLREEDDLNDWIPDQVRNDKTRAWIMKQTQNDKATEELREKQNNK